MPRQKKAPGLKQKPGRKPWASGTKLAFLERHLDDFNRTPQKNRGRLYDRVALKFRAKYGADFNYDKDDLEEDTPDPTSFPYEHDTTDMTEEEAQRSSEYFDRLRDKIQVWFRNTTTKVDLEATPVETIEEFITEQQPSNSKPQKYNKLRISQFYSTLHYDERVKDRFEEVWAKEVAAWEAKLAAWKAAGVDVPAGEAPPAQVGVRGRVTEACWEAESAPFQARVVQAQEEEEKAFYAAAEAAAAARAAAPRVEKTAEDYMRAIDSAAGYTQPFSDALGRTTGCCVAILVAGPMPRQGGKIGMLSIHSGVIPGVAEYLWPEWDVPGFELVERSFIGFAEHVFPPAIQAARSALTPGQHPLIAMDVEAEDKVDAESSEQPQLTRLHRRLDQGPVLRGVHELFTPPGSPAPANSLQPSIEDPSEVGHSAESQHPSLQPAPLSAEPMISAHLSGDASRSSAAAESAAPQSSVEAAPSSLDAPKLPRQTSPISPAAPLPAPATFHTASPLSSHPSSPATSPPTTRATSPLTTSAQPTMPAAPQPAPLARPSTSVAASSATLADAPLAPLITLHSAPTSAQPSPTRATSPREPTINAPRSAGPIPEPTDDVHDPDVANGEAHSVWTQGVPGDSSKHVQDILAACARGRCWGFAFADALDSFIAFEHALGFPDKNGGRAVAVTGLRPPVYTEWLQARRPYDRVMAIGEVSEFGKAWWKWWSVVQPSTRTSASGELLALEALYVNPVALDQMNGLHLCCGKDGLIQFLVALLWWGDAVNGGTDQQGHATEQWVDWETAVLDFRDILVLLVQTPGFNEHARAFARDCHALRASRVKAPAKRVRATGAKEDGGRRLRSSSNNVRRTSKRRKVAE